MEKTKLRIVEIPQTLPGEFYSDGQVFLDVFDDFDLRLSKYLEQLTILNKITQQASISTPLPRSPKNRILLERFEINNLNQEPDPVRIEVIKEGTRVFFDRLRVIESRFDEYEIEIFGGGWIDDLKDLRLRDVEIGTYSYILGNVLSNWANPTQIVYPTVAHYGAFNQAGEISREDLRFDFNVLKVLQKAFAAIGWTFRSSYLEGPVGSRLYAYLSGEDWYKYRDKHDTFRVDLNIATPQALSGTISTILFDEVSDPLNLYNNLTIPAPAMYFYPTTAQDPGVINIRFEDFTFTLPPPAPGDPQGQLLVALFKNDINNLLYVQLFDGPLEGEPDLTFVLNEEILDENANGVDRYGVFLGYADYNSDSPTAIPFTFESGDCIYETQPSKYIKDDTITLEDLIDPEITAFDLLNGITHMIDGKFNTNYPAREVWLYPPFSVDQLDETVEGFLLKDKTPTDLSDKIVTNSRKVSVKKNKQARYVELQFKNSSDPWIKNRQLASQPFSRTVDLGKGEVKTQKLANKLFEPTLEIKPEADDVGPGLDPPYIPARWDNTDGNISNKIKPRIGFCYGLVEQYGDDGVTPYEFVFEGTTRTSLGYVSQAPSRSTDFGDAVHIAYGSYGDDFYELMYRKSLATKFPPFSVDFLLFITYNEYLNYTFRRPYTLFYNDTLLYYQLTAIRDFKLDGKTSTPAEFIVLE